MNNGCFLHKASCDLRRQCLDLVVLVLRYLGLRLKGLVFSLKLYVYAFLDISFHFIYYIAKSSLDKSSFFHESKSHGLKRHEG